MTTDRLTEAELQALEQRAVQALKVAPGELSHECASQRNSETAHNTILDDKGKCLADSLNGEVTTLHMDYDEDGTWYTDQGTYDLFKFWETATPATVLRLLAALRSTAAAVTRTGDGRAT